MPNSKNKKSILVDKDSLERFDYLYPRLVGLFCTRAIKLALQDKELFEKIYFNPIFMEVK